MFVRGSAAPMGTLMVVLVGGDQRRSGEGQGLIFGNGRAVGRRGEEGGKGGGGNEKMQSVISRLLNNEDVRKRRNQESAKQKAGARRRVRKGSTERKYWGRGRGQFSKSLE